MGATVRLGLQLAAVSKRFPGAFPHSSPISSYHQAAFTTRRTLSSRAAGPVLHNQLKTPRLAASFSPPRQSNNPTNPPSSFFTPSLCRHASTTASPETSAAASSTSNPSLLRQKPQSLNSSLDWNTFFKLRSSRRRYSLIFSVISSAITFTATVIAVSTYTPAMDFISKIFPTDPFIALGIATLAATLLGWLIGPFFGNSIWRLFHRRQILEFLSKEKAFFERIKRHRVNPSGASANNPVPDYYGEKIGSVQGYRRWLKDQRAFNRKREGSYIP